MKKPWVVLTVAVCLLVLVSLAAVGCGNGGGDDALLGVWADPSGPMEYEFKSDGTLVLRYLGEEQETTYTAEEGTLIAVDPDTGESEEIEYTVSGATLVLGADGEYGTLARKE
jgi:Family of unknown function (DUF5640)